ncbi:hypothetical protein [uncultured Alistipes sp.]|uniref:hypothetical protein n=1 Tax=uncultured Alistipes sp. TaxID=538949 RepID=UPI0026155154|nr:hypothetical protein [uncultured Alistipes sp.]
MSAFYQISYDYKSIDKDEIIKDRIKQFGDYCNVFPGIWLIYTDVPYKDIYQRIANEQFEDIALLVLKIDITTYWGRMDKSLWDWLKKDRSQK